MHSQMVSIKITARLLKEIDETAKANHQSRSSFIRQSVTMRLNNQRIVTESSEDEFLNNLERMSQAANQKEE